MANNYHNDPADSESAGLTANCDDLQNETGTSPIRKPTHSFETGDGTLIDRELEHGSSTRSKRKHSNWWSVTKDTVRFRRNNSLDIGRGRFNTNVANEAGTTLPEITTRTPSKKRICMNHVIFGGISGMAILAIFLGLNLVLIFATSTWSRDADTALQNWGRPGTGTEFLSWYPTDFTRGILPIPCHSHNDYWRKVPLFSALRAGCTGVESDVWLFDNELYVGHNTASLTTNRTFTSLYVNPLVKILEDQNQASKFYKGHNHGVFDKETAQTLTLLVDVKTNGEETWPLVVSQLQPLREHGWLSFVKNNKFHKRAVTVVGTGHTPFDLLVANTTYRDTFFDAPLDKMWEARKTTPDMSDWPEYDESMSGGEPVIDDAGNAEEAAKFNSTNSYYASASFVASVGRLWRGHLSPRQLEILRGQVRGAHRRGLKARYWDLPAWPIGLRNHIWDVLIKEGVDVLNVDDLRAVSKAIW